MVLILTDLKINFESLAFDLPRRKSPFRDQNLNFQNFYEVSLREIVSHSVRGLFQVSNAV